LQWKALLLGHSYLLSEHIQQFVIFLCITFCIRSKPTMKIRHWLLQSWV